MFDLAIVIGSCGAVGQLLYRSLTDTRAARATVGVDIYPAGPQAQPEQYCQADASAPCEKLQTLLGAADVVIVCLPEAVAMQSAPRLLSFMAPGALWVDTLSVKGPIVELLGQHAGKGFEAISINPMFAPGLGWASKPVAAVLVARGARGRSFLAALEQWGAIVEELSAQEHDELTASVQAATHACAIVFGMTLLELRYETNRALKLSTPPHRLLVALLNRIVSQNPEVYWEIQRDHPLGATARRFLTNSAANFDALISGGDRAQFQKIFEEIRCLLGPEHERLTTLTDAVIETASQRPPS